MSGSERGQMRGCSQVEKCVHGVWEENRGTEGQRDRERGTEGVSGRGQTDREADLPTFPILPLKASR